MSPHIEEFRAAIIKAGIPPPDKIVDDGKLHRFSSSGERGDDAGYYVLHVDGVPAGMFGDWRTGTEQKWRADIGRRTLIAYESAETWRRSSSED